MIQLDWSDDEEEVKNNHPQRFPPRKKIISRIARPIIPMIYWQISILHGRIGRCRPPCWSISCWFCSANPQVVLMFQLSGCVTKMTWQCSNYYMTISPIFLGGGGWFLSSHEDVMFDRFFFSFLQDPQVSVADVLAFLHSVREGGNQCLKGAGAGGILKNPWS